MPFRTYLLPGGGSKTIQIPECVCNAPRLPAHIKRGVCGNCNGARGDDCKHNKPIQQVG